MALVELVTPSGLAPRSLAEKLRRAAGATRAPTPVVQAGSPAGTSGASTCPVATLANASEPNSEIRRATIQFEFFHIILGICVNGSSFFEMRRLVGAFPACDSPQCQLRSPSKQRQGTAGQSDDKSSQSKVKVSSGRRDPNACREHH